MALNDNMNVFKKIIPKEQLSEADKKSVMDTIATTKLIMETLDIISTKQAQTKFEIFKNAFNDSDDQ